jgi:hypothetical protein
LADPGKFRTLSSVAGGLLAYAALYDVITSGAAPASAIDSRLILSNSLQDFVGAVSLEALAKKDGLQQCLHPWWEVIIKVIFPRPSASRDQTAGCAHAKGQPSAAARLAEQRYLLFITAR